MGRIRRTGLAVALAFGCGASSLGAQVLVVLDGSSSTAMLVDPETHRQVGRIPTGPDPREVAVSPDGRYAYVTSYADAYDPGPGDSLPAPWLTVLDLASGEVSRTYDAGGYGKLHGIVASRDGQRLWATAEADSAVVEIDARTGDVLMLWKTGGARSHTVLTSLDARTIFIGNADSDSISVIDRQTVVARRIFTGSRPEGMALSPDGHELWIAHRGDHTIRVISPRTLQEIATFDSGGNDPVRIAFSPNGRDVWVAHRSSQEVVVLDIASAAVMARIPLDTAPRSIAFGRDRRKAYVSSPAGRRVYEIDTEDWSVESFEVAGRPLGLAWSPGVGAAGPDR